MAHRLSPKSGRSYLTPSEVVRRLREEFAIVDTDRDAGADHVGDMIAQFLRMRAPDEIVEAHRKAQPEAVWVTVADEPSGERALSFVAMPGEGLFIGYHSGEQERATEGLLRRSAAALGYEIELV
ncbi:hypothetical protein Psta_0433 [Pirellula staleyi DSM 6068]|uniref:Uncharacterized protein n=1 Tax=Pirellula staleyi (strain ATCC 27377 / DSM 6068 / ICPB 4128) TaxID=530564 RepID=D2R392_PIRSD|nr:hypothetical protein [Pirellula staleyi]ADB15123.1 hypothetical protein Psta_0433 [Pirellula staleyi DSM 6068]